ncbi:MAG: T9SS type A sorting domain-containing protein [Flavobacteriales bacterium]
MIRVLALILLCNIAFGQKTESRNSLYPIDELKAQHYTFSAFDFPDNEAAVSKYLSQKLNIELNLLYVKVSPGGKHYSFQQSINNIAIYRAQVKVNVLKNKKAVDVYALTFPKAISGTFGNAAIAENFIAQQSNISKSNYRKIYYFQHSQLIPAYLIYLEKKGCKSEEFILNNQGAIVYSADLLSYSGKTDSTAVLTVFNPDPITSAQTTYGAPYADDNNNDNASLHNELQQKALKVKFQNDTFYLENDYYKIADVDLPSVTPAFSTIDSFNFNRSENGFEDVNSFYHISTYRNHVKSLGFHNLVDFALSIDPHAHSGGDNSSFNEFSSPVSLLFGDGGVDDAEDADVVVHEFGHAISAAAAPFSNNGWERKAVDEGFGDYIAASYSRSASSYHWEEIFNWDGHNEFWEGRTAVTDRHYPEDITSNKWRDGEMWSATLMQIQDDLGVNITDSIVYQALYGQTSNTNMRDAAQLIIDADTALFNGKYSAQLYQRLSARGFLEAIDSTVYLTQNDIAVFNTWAFATGGEVIVAFNTKQDVTLELFDAAGRLIDKASATSISQSTYSNSNISSGIYLLRISTSSAKLTVKLSRY